MWLAESCYVVNQVDIGLQLITELTRVSASCGILV